MAATQWKLEADVNRWVERKLNDIGLVIRKDLNDESTMSDYMKQSLAGSAKTKNKTNFGVPDYHLEKYRVPIII